MPAARLIAYHLPQFYPFPENDDWWGPGFTEWTNTAKAKPLFNGHYQPHVPADLGFYDMRMPEARQAQADLARAYGIEGFCYYHYWWAGKRLLEKPVDAIIASREPDFPFCLCWANETWTGIWHGAPNRVLMEQTYPGEDDHRRHFDSVLPALADPRAIRIDGRPVFVVYEPRKIPEPRAFTALWRDLAEKAGLPGIYFIGLANKPWSPEENGFDAASSRNHHLVAQHAPSTLSRKIRTMLRRLRGEPLRVYDYAEAIKYFHMSECDEERRYPSVVPNWDNSPRSGHRGLILHNSTPELFRIHLRQALDQVAPKQPEHQVVFVKSWNEWAEGNYLEPDLRFGHTYLEVVREELARMRAATGSAVATKA